MSHSSYPETASSTRSSRRLRWELLPAFSAAGEALAGAYVAGSQLFAPGAILLALISAALFAAGGHFTRYFREALRLASDTRADRAASLPREDWRRGCLLLLVAAVLLAVGMLLPFGLGIETVLAGVGVTLALVVYAALAEPVWGANFLTFGAARGLNFVFGLTAITPLNTKFLVAAIPSFLFATGWATLRYSRHRAAPPVTGFVALVHLVAAMVTLLYLANARFYYPLDSVIFLAALMTLTLPRLVNANVDLRWGPALEAVQYGYLGFTLLHASLAAGYTGLRAGLVVAVFCLPIYLLLKRSPIPLASDAS